MLNGFLLQPCQFRLDKLSLVRITWQRNHIKILVFKGTLIFQIKFVEKSAWSLIKSWYKDLTVKTPEVVRFRLETSGSSVIWISINLSTKWIHLCHLLPVKVLLKEILTGGACAKTEPIVTSYLWTILYNEGYWLDKGVSPNQLSSQKHILSPLPTKKDPRFKNSSFTFTSPFQKGESVGQARTCVNDLECKYLLQMSSCHTPSPDNIL